MLNIHWRKVGSIEFMLLISTALCEFNNFKLAAIKAAYRLRAANHRALARATATHIVSVYCVDALERAARRTNPSRFLTGWQRNLSVNDFYVSKCFAFDDFHFMKNKDVPNETFDTLYDDDVS
ncbi:unnamed protein product [Parnassius mnemosyne]|uniref:Uncharacterized protein n=1 Tax=Parnassius mnemosyne TaxID=213953 RepID=A0AAV1LXZ7_9NEOP